MNRTLIALLLSLGFANTISAATIDANFVTGLTYASGDTITIDLVATVSPPEPTSALLLCCDVRLLGSGAIAWSGATQTGMTSFDGALSWMTFDPICSGSDPCIAVNQYNPIVPQGAQPDPFDGVIATATGTIVGAPGTYQVDLVPAEFFSAFDTTPTSSTTITIVPEPGTAALLLLGLLGLEVGRRAGAA